MSYWFYYNSDGNKQGAVTDEQLKELAANGKITPGTMIEHAKSGDKTIAAEVKWLTFGETVAQTQPRPISINESFRLAQTQSATPVNQTIPNVTEKPKFSVKNVIKGCGCASGIFFGLIVIGIIGNAIDPTTPEEKEQQKQQRQQQNIEREQKKEQRAAERKRQEEKKTLEREQRDAERQKQEEEREARLAAEPTLAKFSRIRIGMTAREVVEFMGTHAQWEITSESVTGSVKTEVIEWKERYALWNVGTIRITFQNGRVVSKEQTGLK